MLEVTQTQQFISLMIQALSWSFHHNIQASILERQTIKFWQEGIPVCAYDEKESKNLVC